MSLKPRLIDDWKEAWKWGSARLMALLGVAEAAYGYIQADPQLAEAASAYVSPSKFHLIMGVLALLTLASKLFRFDQPK